LRIAIKSSSLTDNSVSENKKLTMDEHEILTTLKILIIGESGVGKSR